MSKIIDLYFQNYDYFKSKGKGLSIFNSSESTFNQIKNILIENNIDTLAIKSSENLNSKLNLVSNCDHLLIFEDISKQDLQKKAEFIVKKILFTALYREIPISFISIFDQSMYSDITIQSDLIHKDIQEVLSNLYIEQIFMLLQQVNLSFANESIEINNTDNIFYTPIEMLLRDEMIARKMSYTPQAKFGRFYVDFLVEKDKKQVIVECDGRDFHSPTKDQQREEIISQFNIPFLRFSGSQLHTNTKSCVDEIEYFFHGIKESRYYRLDSDLDDSQKGPVNQIDGPIRVLAPAGSGKTKTLTNRVLSLLNKGINPNQILVLAFNKKAALQMVEKLEAKGVQTTKKLSDDGVSVRTFHSFGYEIIHNQLKWQFNLANNRKQEKAFLTKASQNILDNLPGYKRKDAIETLLITLRKVKLELSPISSLTMEIDGKVCAFEHIFNKYIELQTENNFISFDDMVYLAIRLILSDRILRQNLQRRFDYILVDEFQDLNEAQLLLLQSLSLPNYNLFIVGDDDQMIYGWRGAKVEHILKFNEKYAFSKDYVLGINYRSAKCIVRHSGFLIDHNQYRVKKNIKPHSTNSDGRLEISLNESIFKQAADAVNWIVCKKKEQSLKWSDFAILFRYHEFVFPLAMILDSMQIPHTPIQSSRLFKTLPGSDIYSYLTVLLHPNDATKDDFVRILRRPNKYIPNEVIAKCSDWESFKKLSDTREMPNWLANNLKDFTIKIDSLQHRVQDYMDSPVKYINSVYDEFNFKQFYSDKTSPVIDLDQAEDLSKMEVIISVANTFCNLNDFYSFIFKSIHEEVDIIDSESEEHPDWVYLSSIHSSKGKEFNNVVLFNLSPTLNSVSNFEDEEERRICYVGFTRAKLSIYITALKEPLSKFLIELLFNPKFKQCGTNELQSELAQSKAHMEMIKSRIEQVEFKIINILSQFPEIEGKDGPDLTNSLLRRYLVKAQRIRDEYVRLSAEEVNQTSRLLYVISENYRKLKIELVKDHLTRIEKRVNRLKIALFEHHKKELEKARKELLNNITNKSRIENNEMFPLKLKLDEINYELRFRKLLKMSEV